MAPPVKPALSGSRHIVPGTPGVISTQPQPKPLAELPHQKWQKLKALEHGQHTWKLCTTRKDWTVDSDGYGEVTFSKQRGIVMRPKAPLSNDPLDTHASILWAKKTLEHPLRNFEVTVRFSNDAQLRPGKPQAWEVFWLIFNRTIDDRGKKKANYVTIKPSVGPEIGRMFDEVGQEFMQHQNIGPMATAEIGKTYTMTVRKVGPEVTVFLDGRKVATYTNATAPSSKYLYDVPGAIGLYCEDAQVRVSSVTIKPL